VIGHYQVELSPGQILRHSLLTHAELKTPPTTFSTPGTVIVAVEQSAGTFILEVGAFGIRNSNQTGAKLGAGSSSRYEVIVSAPSPPADNEPPETYILSGPSGWINTNTATFTWTGSDNVTPEENLVYSYQLDSGDWSPWTSDTSITYNDLSEGSHTFEVKAKDEAGNEDPSPATQEFGVDITPPEVTITTPDDGATYLLNQKVLADWTADDNLSGISLAFGTVPNENPIDTASVGSKSFEVWAEDNAENTATKTVSYSVIYGFNGLLSPYVGPPKAFKLGSSIPLKWQYTDYSGTAIDSPAANPSVVIKLVVPGDTLTEKPMELNDPGSSGLRYDALTMTWQFNWQTKGLTAGGYNIYIISGQTGQINGPFPIALKK